MPKESASTFISSIESYQVPITLAAVHAGSALAQTRPRKRSPSKPITRSPRGETARHRVLVVDDVADVTEMMSLFLKHAGYEVITANSAGDAIDFANRTNFDLVISDIGMPEMNGYELAESLRAEARYRSTPMIAVTGYTEYDDRGRSLRAGFNAHLTKPINPAQLLSLIHELLS